MMDYSDNDIVNGSSNKLVKKVAEFERLDDGKSFIKV